MKTRNLFFQELLYAPLELGSLKINGMLQIIAEIPPIISICKIQVLMISGLIFFIIFITCMINLGSKFFLVFKI